MKELGTLKCTSGNNAGCEAPMYTMLPSVSCILPCGYGDKFVDVAIQCWLDQNYAGPLELVIVDNNESAVEFGVQIPQLDPQCIQVVYHRAPRGKSVGFYRNLGTSLAHGEICITWDEDDWSHPDRIAEQVTRLQESGKAVTGFHNLFYYDTETGGTYKYHFEMPGRNHPPYAMGTSQCYLKSWWEQHKFPEDQAVEDFGFQQVAMHAKQLDSVDAGHLCVARAHRDSKCPPSFGHHQFPAVGKDELPKEFFDAIGSKVAQTEIPPMADTKEQ